LKIEAKPFYGSQDNRNRLGTLLITNSRSYEHSLQQLSESWRKSAQLDSVKISDSSVDGLKKYKPPVDEADFYGEHFVIRGHLQDIKENKDVPDSLKNTVSSRFLKPNNDMYLSAKLVDNTGSVYVFLQTTSLNSDELSMERDRNVFLFYYEHNPILVVRFSPLSEYQH